MKALTIWALLPLALWHLASGPVLAQADKLKVQVSYVLGKPPLELERLVLRPNTTQAVYFYLTNPDEEPRRNVNFKLVRVAPDGQPFVLQQTTVPVIGGQKTVRVTFGKGAETPKVEPGKEGKDAKPLPPPVLPKLEGPPFRMQVWLESDKSPEPTKISVPVLLMEPREYVSVGTGMTYDIKNSRLSVRVRSSKDFTGPPCPVQLVLQPDLLPGLVQTKKGGVFKQLLTEPDQEIELIAIDLRFQDAPPKNGRISLTVDGYERAFVFKTTFAQGILPTLGEEKRVRIYAPHYSQPGPKFPVRLEVDGPPSTPARVELGIDRVGTGQTFDGKLFRGLRRQSVAAGTSPEGDLLFQTEVEDWRFEIDTTDVFGKRLLQAMIFDGYEGKRDTVPIADEQNQREETILLFLPGAQDLFAPLSFSRNAVFAEVILDATVPEDLRFVKLPTALQQGQAHLLRVKASVKPRSPDQAPISKVKFYLGKATPDGKVPDDAVDGKATDATGEFWDAELLVPSDRRDRFEVSVMATTRTGVAAETTARILLTVPGGTTAKKVARITGTVREGDRLIPGLAVTLSDDKGKPKMTVKTNDKGEYVFENVPPGTYGVAAIRTASRTSASRTVTVLETSETISKIDLRLFR